MYKFELAKLMHQYSRNSLLSYFNTFFQKVSSIHNRNTRSHSQNQRWSRGHKVRGQGQGPKKIRGQGQGQKCSRPRPRTKDTNASVFLRKKILKNFFRSISKKKKNGLEKHFSADLQNFNHSKSSAVLEPRTGQFSRT